MPILASHLPLGCLVTPLYLLDPLAKPWDSLLTAMTSSSSEMVSMYCTSSAYFEMSKLVLTFLPLHLSAATSYASAACSSSSYPPK